MNVCFLAKGMTVMGSMSWCCILHGGLLQVYVSSSYRSSDNRDNKLADYTTMSFSSYGGSWRFIIGSRSVLTQECYEPDN